MADQRIYIHQLPNFDVNTNDGYVLISNLTNNTVNKLNSRDIAKTKDIEKVNTDLKK